MKLLSVLLILISTNLFADTDLVCAKNVKQIKNLPGMTSEKLPIGLWIRYVNDNPITLHIYQDLDTNSLIFFAQSGSLKFKATLEICSLGGRILSREETTLYDFFVQKDLFHFSSEPFDPNSPKTPLEYKGYTYTRLNQ